MNEIKTVECKRCGSRNVAWKQTKAGKWYLAIVLPPTLDHSHSLVIGKPHASVCDAIRKDNERWAAMAKECMAVSCHEPKTGAGEHPDHCARHAKVLAEAELP